MNISVSLIDYSFADSLIPLTRYEKIRVHKSIGISYESTNTLSLCVQTTLLGGFVKQYGLSLSSAPFSLYNPTAIKLRSKHK